MIIWVFQKMPEGDDIRKTNSKTIDRPNKKVEGSGRGEQRKLTDCSIIDQGPALETHRLVHRVQFSSPDSSFILQSLTRGL